jgi:hypothetical protein
VFGVLLIRTTLNSMELLKKVIEEHHSNKIQPKGIAAVDCEIVGRRYVTTFFTRQLPTAVQDLQALRVRFYLPAKQRKCRKLSNWCTGVYGENCREG